MRFVTGEEARSRVRLCSVIRIIESHDNDVVVASWCEKKIQDERLTNIRLLTLATHMNNPASSFVSFRHPRSRTR
eukprot:scaffold7558_cov76-Amphora_coffeaeformis.AAC.1